LEEGGAAHGTRSHQTITELILAHVEQEHKNQALPIAKGGRISRRLRIAATVVTFCAVATLCAVSASPAPVKELLYTTSDAGSGAELFAIEVTGSKITTTDIGPTMGGDCVSLALSPFTGQLFSMCGPLFGNQQLAPLDPRTGLANLIGVPVSGLSVMAMAFAPNCNPDANFECNASSSPPDPNYNSLYTVNTLTGAFTRVGATGAPQFFMDLAFDQEGHMIGVTTTDNPSMVAAVLYRINLSTGKATKIVRLVGSNSIMGIAFGSDDKLYATDFVEHSGLYLIDIETGFERAIAALPFGFSSGLELANPSFERL